VEPGQPVNERAPADADARERWTHGDPYEQYVGRWSRLVAPAFLSWLRLPPGRRWVDVGCGTGALCDAICRHCSPATVIGIEPSEGFLQAARVNLAGRAVVRQGNATQIPLDDASVDAVVSALALNFVDDPRAALVEMGRVTARGGTIAAYVWDYAGRMDLMRLFWDAAVDLDPAAARLDEGVRFPLCRPEPLQELFAGSGLADVAVTPIDVPTRFADFDDYWRPFLGGQGPAPTYVMSLDDTARARLRERLRERLPSAGDGSISLIARAWAVRGVMMRAR
jgi:SAM-dependent methyltransferase